MQFRRNTAAGAAVNNRVMLAAEGGFTTDTFEFKISDGVIPWNDLPYPNGGAVAVTGLDATGTVAATTRIQAELGPDRVVRLPPGRFLVGQIDVAGCDGMTLEGAGPDSTVLFTNTATNSVLYSTGAVSNLTIRGIGFEGKSVDDALVTPRRSRTTTGLTFFSAIQLFGDLDPDGVYPIVENVRIDDVHVTSCSQLPILLAGIRGEAKITNSRFTNTMDVGWKHCEQAICIDNTAVRSADNGFSLSRGNHRVVCVGNTTDLCAYFGIWISGFDVAGGNDKGPTDFVCTGNVCTRSGRGGIILSNAPKRGVVTGNTVHTVYRGDADDIAPGWGVGIFVGGFPSAAPTTPTDWADSIIVSDNVVAEAQRGGILVRGVRNFAIHDNVIVDPGTLLAADGVTTILTTDNSTNFGIAAENNTTVSNGSVKGNHLIDTRGTPLGNSPYFFTSATGIAIASNKITGTWRQMPAFDDNVVENVSGTKTYFTNAKFRLGLTAGENAGAGTVPGLDINGAAGSTRPNRWLTGGVARWAWEATNTAESGSNVGTDMALRAYNDAGTLLFTALTVKRSTGKVSLTVGLGVGNSAAATAVGALSRKMEVFDAAGASLGFVPIYTTIT